MKNTKICPKCNSSDIVRIDEHSLLRMQEILFYRELDFSLKSIGEILSSPNYDARKLLEEQML